MPLRKSEESISGIMTEKYPDLLFELHIELDESFVIEKNLSLKYLRLTVLKLIRLKWIHARLTNLPLNKRLNLVRPPVVVD